MGVNLNKLFAGWDLVSHENREDLVGTFGIGDFYFFEHSLGWIHGSHPELLGVHFSQTLVALNGYFLTLIGFEDFVSFCVGIDVVLVFLDFESIEWGHGDVEVATFDNLGEVAVEESEGESGNVFSINIGIVHQNNAMVAELVCVISLADSCSQSDN